jgi:hypothetical protein
VLERSQTISQHCDKVAKLIDGIIRHVDHQNNSQICAYAHSNVIPNGDIRGTQGPSYPVLTGLLGRVRAAVIDMKQFVGPVDAIKLASTSGGSRNILEFDINLSDSETDTAAGDKTHAAHPSSNHTQNVLDLLMRKQSELASVSKSEILDNALLDMCSNLEEENSRLQECIGA